MHFFQLKFIANVSGYVTTVLTVAQPELSNRRRAVLEAADEVARLLDPSDIIKAYWLWVYPTRTWIIKE